MNRFFILVFNSNWEFISYKLSPQSWEIRCCAIRIITKIKVIFTFFNSLFNQNSLAFDFVEPKSLPTTTLVRWKLENFHWIQSSKLFKLSFLLLSLLMYQMTQHFIYNETIKLKDLRGAVVAQWVRSWFNLKTLCAKGRMFKSPYDRLIQGKFSMKRKNSMIYAPTTTALHSSPSRCPLS